MSLEGAGRIGELSETRQAFKQEIIGVQCIAPVRQYFHILQEPVGRQEIRRDSIPDQPAFQDSIPAPGNDAVPGLNPGIQACAFPAEPQCGLGRDEVRVAVGKTEVVLRIENIH